MIIIIEKKTWFYNAIVVAAYLPSCIGQESKETFLSSSQAAFCLPVDDTRWILDTVPFCC